MFTDIWEVRLVHAGTYQSVWLRWPFSHESLHRKMLKPWGWPQQRSTPSSGISEIIPLLTGAEDRSESPWEPGSRLNPGFWTQGLAWEPGHSCGNQLPGLWPGCHFVKCPGMGCQVHRDGVGKVMSPLQPSVWFMTNSLFSEIVVSLCTHRKPTFPIGSILLWVAVTSSDP